MSSESRAASRELSARRDEPRAKSSKLTAQGSKLVLPGSKLGADSSKLTPRNADVIAFEASMVDFFVDAAELLGVPKSVAAIYGIVFASPVPLSFADIADRLDFSKGSISQGLRVLRDMGAVKEVSTEADRAEFFSPDLQLRNLVARFLENRLQTQLAAGSTRLTQLSKAVPGKNGEAKLLRERLKHLQNWHDKARALLPIAKTFLKLGG